MTKSFGVTFAMSSILSTSACGVGTHTTSLPGWPTRGSNCAAGVAGVAGLAGVAGAWANAAVANKTVNSVKND